MMRHSTLSAYQQFCQIKRLEGGGGGGGGGSDVAGGGSFGTVEEQVEYRITGDSITSLTFQLCVSS